jgi:hypothetical protein
MPAAAQTPDTGKTIGTPSMPGAAETGRTTDMLETRGISATGGIPPGPTGTPPYQTTGMQSEPGQQVQGPGYEMFPEQTRETISEPFVAPNMPADAAAAELPPQQERREVRPPERRPDDTPPPLRLDQINEGQIQP